MSAVASLPKGAEAIVTFDRASQKVTTTAEFGWISDRAERRDSRRHPMAARELTRQSHDRAPAWQPHDRATRARLPSRWAIDRGADARRRTARIEIARKLTGLWRGRNRGRRRQRQIRRVREAQLARRTPFLQRIERRRRHAGVVADVDRRNGRIERRRRREDGGRANVATRSRRKGARRDQPKD